MSEQAAGSGVVEAALGRALAELEAGHERPYYDAAADAATRARTTPR